MLATSPPVSPQYPLCNRFELVECAGLQRVQAGSTFIFPCFDLQISSVRSPFSASGWQLKQIPQIYSTFQRLKGFVFKHSINKSCVIKMKTLISPEFPRHYPQTSSREGTWSFLYLHNSLTWLLYSSSPAHYAPLVLLGFKEMEGRRQERGKQV